MKTYTIPQGQNYCREWWRKRLLWKPRGMTAKVKFNASAIYKSQFNGWQKIVGFSLGYHHQNSFRFVWRVVNGFFQIGAYQYVGGVRHEARVIFTQKLIEYHPKLIWNSEKYGKHIVKEFVQILEYRFPDEFDNEFVLEIDLIDNENLVCYRTRSLTPIYFISDLSNLPSIGYTLQPYYEQPKEIATGAPHTIAFEMETKFY